MAAKLFLMRVGAPVLSGFISFTNQLIYCDNITHIRQPNYNKSLPKKDRPIILKLRDLSSPKDHYELSQWRTQNFILF
jgi:hypothetical protein